MATLKQSFAGQPFKILAFPCNEFLHQEPGSNAVIEKFAAGFGNFSMMAKSDVNSECQSSDAGQCAPASTECCSANNAVYPYLKGVLPGKISWNFKQVPGGQGRRADQALWHRGLR
jgi:glutathione peroxidase-family protein